MFGAMWYLNPKWMSGKEEEGEEIMKGLQKEVTLE